MKLAALQHDMRTWLTDGFDDIDRWLDTEARSGLAIYHNAYRVQLSEALAERFEKTHSWIGDDAFFAAVRIHIESTPPHSWTMDAYGGGFDRSLASLYPDDPEVAELARLDHALACAFIGTDSAPLAREKLAAIEWENAALTFAPTVALTATTTNAGAIWSALSAGIDPPAAETLPAAGAMLVWRQGFTPCFRTIDSVEHNALELMLAGETFGRLCENLITVLGDAQGVSEAGKLLGQWLQDGLITEITELKADSCA